MSRFSTIYSVQLRTFFVQSAPKSRLLVRIDLSNDVSIPRRSWLHTSKTVFDGKDNEPNYLVKSEADDEDARKSYLVTE